MNRLMETLLPLLASPQSSETEHQAAKESNEAVQAARERLTLKEFDDFWNAVTNIENASHVDSFTLGFRLGVQLTLEGLRPIVE